MTDDPLPTDIDTLMSLNPLDLSPDDISEYLARVIAYQRQSRAQREAGIKPKREKAKGLVKGTDLLKTLGLGQRAEVPKSTPGSGGLRRI